MGALDGLEQQKAHAGIPPPQRLCRRFLPACSLPLRRSAHQAASVEPAPSSAAHGNPGQADRWAGPSAFSGNEARATLLGPLQELWLFPGALCFHFLPVPFFALVLLMTFQPSLLFIESFTQGHRKML